ncbi:MAG: hypothetical protein JNL57_01455 [Bacteroidetes bacterium]|nr:hypothetical protein [Bacteroidota bacterium]
MENQPLDNQFHVPNAGGNTPLPNATAVLVLGILSIVGCFCYGIIGVILGIIAMVLASKDMQAYKLNPGIYSAGSYNNMKAGRICAIIGVCLGALYIIVLIAYLAIVGSMLSLGKLG